MTLTFDPRSLISIGSEPVQKSAIQRKPRPNRLFRSAGILFTRNPDTDRQTDRQTDRHTHRHTDKLQWKYNLSTISWRCNEENNATLSSAIDSSFYKINTLACSLQKTPKTANQSRTLEWQQWTTMNNTRQPQRQPETFRERHEVSGTFQKLSGTITAPQTRKTKAGAEVFI